jgi:hypothetical protein
MFAYCGQLSRRDLIGAFRMLQLEWNQHQNFDVVRRNLFEEATMGFGRGILLWLLGVPIPLIILIALFWHH